MENAKDLGNDMLRKDLSSSEYRVYVNLCKDGRYRALKVYNDGTRQSVSYPRLIVEQSIGRPLLPTEDVHHLDENPSNNDLDNLEIVDHREHTKQHILENSKYNFLDDYIDVTCVICGKSFTISRKSLLEKLSSVRTKHKSDKFFCSRSCSGKYGKMIQESRQFEPIDRDIYRDPCELGEIFSDDNP